MPMRCPNTSTKPMAEMRSREFLRCASLSLLLALMPGARSVHAEAPSPPQAEASPAAEASTAEIPLAQDAAAASATAEATAEPPAAPRVIVEQPRPYGYLVGDLLQQEVRLTVDDQPVEIVDLPRRDRIGVWLARRDTVLLTRADGTRWMRLEYQIVNASKDVDVITLPKLHLRTTTPKVFLDVPEWPVTVGAITASTVRNQGGLLPLQPDAPAPRIAIGVLRHRLTLALLGLVATLAGWLGWWQWREWQARAAQPFARARTALRRLDADSPEAWRALHRAFDATAGRVLQPATLPLLFAQAPQYAPLREEIERFYAESGARFFGGSTQASTDLRALAARLRRIETRHET